MRIRDAAFSCVLLATCATANLYGQYADDQSKSLRGIKIVVVNFSEPNQKVEAAVLADIQDAAVLELRKAGVRVKKEGDSAPADALINISIGIQTGISDFLRLRMDVEQKVTMVRTSEPLQLVTWYYEDAQNPNSWRTSAKPMVIKGVNKLLSDWLDANGR